MIVIYPLAVVLVIVKARKLSSSLLSWRPARWCSALHGLRRIGITRAIRSHRFSIVSFPNPYVHVQWEEDYKLYFRTYDHEGSGE